jgi:iron complex outermembrane receptor protein
MLSLHMFRRLVPAGAAAGAAAAALMYPSPALAQAVDYGALEQVFGEPVTTSATGKPQRASDVPADMVIVTADDIRRSGATEIPDVLQFVTGIDIRRYSFGDTQIGIHGYDTSVSPRLLVMVDGREVYQNDFGYVNWNNIPVQLSEIRQIEVVKGPASALFGFNAAGGVINIITYDPLLDDINTATARGGTQSYGQGEVVATEHFGTTAGVRLSVGGYTSNGFGHPDGVPSEMAPRYGSLNLSARWQVAPNILLRLETGLTDAHTAMEAAGEGLANIQNHLNYWRLGAAADTRAGLIDLDIYRNQALTNYGALAVSDSNDVLVVKLADLLKPTPSTTIRAGLEYRHNSIQFSDPGGGDASYDNYAANAMFDWQISPAFNLNNAVRLDHLQLHDTGTFVDTPGRTPGIYDATTITQPSFNSGLVIKVTDKDTVRLLAGRGLQVPSLVDFALQTNPAPGVLSVGSPGLAPTAVWNAGIAYDRNLDPLAATLTTLLFFQRNTNLLSAPGSFVVGYANGAAVVSGLNIGSSNEIGFEVGLNGTTPGGIRWKGSYRFASITDDITSVAAAAPGMFNRYDNGTPVHEVILGIGYTLNRVELDALGRWQSSYTDYQRTPSGPEPVIIGNYFSLNARVGYRVTDYLTIAGTAEQFNISRQIETADDYVERRFIASATIKF